MYHFCSFCLKAKNKVGTKESDGSPFAAAKSRDDRRTPVILLEFTNGQKFNPS